MLSEIADARVVRGTRVLVGAVQTLLLTGTSLGLDRRDLLAAAGLSEDALGDRDAYVPFARQVALGEAILRGRPGVSIGLAMLRHASPAMLGLLGYVLTHSATLHDALRAFVRFQGLITDGVRFAVAGDDPARPSPPLPGASIQLRLDADPALSRLAHPIEALAGLWVTIGRRLTGTDWGPLEIRFRHAALSDVREHERFFHVTPVFNAEETAITFSRETMDLPVVAGQPALRPSMVRVCEARLAEVSGQTGLAARVRAALFEQIPRGIASKAAVAKKLALSERTLDRRLRAEGVTYRDVLDGVRRELSLIWLADAQNAVYEVAFLLGYSEPSTFHRSFRRWTGASPLAWRKAHGR